MDFEIMIENDRLKLIPEPMEQLDLYNIFEFDEDMQQILDDPRYQDKTEIVLDLQNIPFMDSSAIGRFIAINRRLTTQKNKKLHLLHLSNSVKQVFEITGTKDFFPIIDE